MERKIQTITPVYCTPAELEHSLRAMAALDIVMNSTSDSWLRLVRKEPAQEVYHIDNGGGDELDVIFSGVGVWLKGFDHENALNQFAAEVWDEDFFKKTYTGVPQAFLDWYTDEEALEMMTFCMWYDAKASCWKQNAVEGNDGGKAYLLGYLCQTADQWVNWAEGYYETALDRHVVEKAYRGESLTEEDIHALNPCRDTQEACKELSEL